MIIETAGEAWVSHGLTANGAARSAAVTPPRRPNQPPVELFLHLGRGPPNGILTNLAPHPLPRPNVSRRSMAEANRGLANLGVPPEAIEITIRIQLSLRVEKRGKQIRQFCITVFV